MTLPITVPFTDGEMKEAFWQAGQGAGQEACKQNVPLGSSVPPYGSVTWDQNAPWNDTAFFWGGMLGRGVVTTTL